MRYPVAVRCSSHSERKKSQARGSLGLVFLTTIIVTASVAKSLADTSPAPHLDDSPQIVAPLPVPACVRALRIARINLEAGDASAAQSSFDKAVAACPGRIEPLLGGIMLAEFSNNVANRERYRRLLIRAVSDVDQPLQLAAIEQAAIDPSLGITELKILQKRLEDATARPMVEPKDRIRTQRVLAMVAIGTGDLDTARRALDVVLTANPSPDVRWTCISIDRELGRWDAVVEQLEKLVDEDEVMARFAQLQLVVAYANAGRLAEAIATAEALIKTEPEEDKIGSLSHRAALALLQAGWDLWVAEKDEAARAAFERALAIDPAINEAADALNLLYGPPSARQERAQREEDELAAVGDPEAWLDAGTQRLAVGDAEGAIDLLRLAAEGLPNHEIAWSNYGIAAVRLERWKVAAAALEKAVALEPSNVTARLNLGTSLAKSGRCERALEVLDALVIDHAERWQAHYWRWWCRNEAGDAAGAAEALAAYQSGRKNE